jgi:hypothetical protein
MDIRKIILSYRLYSLDKKTHVKNWIKDVSTCYDKVDFINLLENWNHHEPERTVKRVLNEYGQYSEAYIDKHIAWSLRSVKEVTGVEFTIDYIDTYQYPDYILDAHERELFADAD